MAFEIIKPFLWALGVGLGFMAIFTFYWPKYQFKFMKMMKLKPSTKSYEKIRKLALLKLAFGMLLIASTAFF